MHDYVYFLRRRLGSTKPNVGLNVGSKGEGGEFDGIDVGLKLGTIDGRLLGKFEGEAVGTLLGEDDGELEGD